MHLRLDWLRGRQNSNRSLPRIFGCSTPEQREAEIGADLLRIGEPDPKHRQGLDVAAHSKRASIDRLKAEIGDEGLWHRHPRLRFRNRLHRGRLRSSRDGAGFRQGSESRRRADPVHGQKMAKELANNTVQDGDLPADQQRKRENPP